VAFGSHVETRRKTRARESSRRSSGIANGPEHFYDVFQIDPRKESMSLFGTHSPRVIRSWALQRDLRPRPSRQIVRQRFAIKAPLGDGVSDCSISCGASRWHGDESMNPVVHEVEACIAGHNWNWS
jgi:hypothetical protein